MTSIELLAQRRRALRLSQQSAAQRAEISIPTLRNLERGKGSLNSLQKLLAVLSMEWAWAPNDASIGPHLAFRRRAKGLSQQGLALRIGCSRQTIASLERHFTGSVATLLKILSILGISPALCTTRAAPGPGLVPATNDPARDLVMTPHPLAAAIIAHFSVQMSGTVLDPAKGGGAFFDQLPNHVTAEWCELAEGRDFLAWTRGVDWVVTNPPWSRLRAFTRHAMDLTDNIIWLAPLVNLTTKARLRDMRDHGFGIAELVLINTPREWPQSGFQLVAAHLQRGHTGAWKVSALHTE